MARILYRIAAVLIVLLDLGHSSGYPWSDPAWGVDLHAMQSSQFDVLGSTRTYWDFYVGFGLSVSVFLLLAAVLAWQLGSVPGQAFRHVRLTAWCFVACLAGIALLDAMYFFIIPIAFSSLITVCLAAATWLATRSVGSAARATS